MIEYTGMITRILKEFSHGEFNPKEEQCSMVYHNNFNLHMLKMKCNNSH